MVNYVPVLKTLASGGSVADELLSILDAEISLPNIPFPTMGGHVFWTTLAEYNGWKLQQNMFTKHARILDSNDVRIAWGSVNGMIKAMDRMVECLNRYGNH